MVGKDERPEVPHGSPDDWYWVDRNEWGFEGWAPEDHSIYEEVWSNFFATACDFGSGIVVCVWDGPPFESGSNEWVIPSMPHDEMIDWIRSHTSAFEQQKERDDFFAGLLEGFSAATAAPEGDCVFRLSDYEGSDRLEVVRSADGRFFVWNDERQLLKEFPDFCAIRHAYDERFSRNWSPMVADDEWKKRWEACS